ncbi:MAG: hypothetical protein DWQ20_08000 [Actinobacteria bacterium]|nr:MAG: hypothetical protein DWQ20_08000 [Actinomycetota bacterium]
MNILVFEGGVIAPNKLGEAQAWLSDNDADLRSTAPEGTTYMGVYSPIFSSSKYPTEVFLVYSVNNYGDLDQLAGASGSRFGRLLGEWDGFLDDDPSLKMSKVLYKSLTAATVWGNE